LSKQHVEARVKAAGCGRGQVNCEGDLHFTLHLPASASVRLNVRPKYLNRFVQRVFHYAVNHTQ